VRQITGAATTTSHKVSYGTEQAQVSGTAELQRGVCAPATIAQRTANETNTSKSPNLMPPSIHAATCLNVEMTQRSGPSSSKFVQNPGRAALRRPRGWPDQACAARGRQRRTEPDHAAFSRFNATTPITYSRPALRGLGYHIDRAGIIGVSLALSCPRPGFLNPCWNKAAFAAEQYSRKWVLDPATVRDLTRRCLSMPRRRRSGVCDLPVANRGTSN